MHNGTFITLSLSFMVSSLSLVPSSVRGESSLSDGGKIIHNGELVFPVGFYHVSWFDYPERQVAPKLHGDLQNMIDNGFNFSFWSYSGERDPSFDNASALDLCGENGMMVIPEISSANQASLIPQALADDKKNALLAFHVADDFNNPANGKTPAEFATLAATTRQHAPNHLLYSSGGANLGWEIADYAAHVDIVSIQVYPVYDDGVYENENSILEYGWDSMRYAYNELDGMNKTLVGVMQTFAWGPYDGFPTEYRMPTPLELRSNTYSAVMHGAAGILFYTYWGNYPVALPEKSPALWEDQVLLAAELSELEPFLLEGTHSFVETGDGAPDLFSPVSDEGGVYCATWELNGKHLIIINNTWRTSDREISIDMSGIAGEQSIHFGSRAGTPLTWDDQTQTLHGTIGRRNARLHHRADESLSAMGRPAIF